VEHYEALVNARVNRAILGWNRRDLDEITRGRHLDELGVLGQVSFGLYVEGLGESEAGSLCDVAVTPTEVIFLDADASAPPEAELGRAPCEGLDVEAASQERTVMPQEFPDAPWTVRSMSAPGAVDLRGQAVVQWADGRATFAFATPEGAGEAVEALRRLLARAADTPAV
jgi:hypothetical protein